MTYLTPTTARELAAALNAWASRKEAGRSSEQELFAVCKAAFDFCEDGAFQRVLDDLCTDMGWDEEGYPAGERDDPFWRDSWHAINVGLGEAA